MKNRIIVGITGASAVIYGIRTLQLLRDMDHEIHLILSEAGKKVIELETNFTVDQVAALAHHVYDEGEIAAPVASGSFLTAGMVIVPCTVKTLSGIANSYTANLLIRAADVTLKERRRLLLGVRETPLHVGHLRLMTRAAENGAIIMPPIPSFYHQPRTIDDLVDQMVGRIFDSLGIENELVKRWKAAASPRSEVLQA